uniref:EF-hand domain-containing protein n=1 Tax=Globodera rostochiensis TaxID=31243 RepID=A0A914HIT5_GLORO
MINETDTLGGADQYSFLISGAEQYQFLIRDYTIRIIGGAYQYLLISAERTFGFCHKLGVPDSSEQMLANSGVHLGPLRAQSLITKRTCGCRFVGERQDGNRHECVLPKKPKLGRTTAMMRTSRAIIDGGGPIFNRSGTNLRFLSQAWCARQFRTNVSQLGSAFGPFTRAIIDHKKVVAMSNKYQIHFCLRKMLIKIGLFLFIFIKLLFVGIIDEVTSCGVELQDFGCCPDGCPEGYKPNCNIFGHNCVGCKYVFDRQGCGFKVACSCFYCCELQYLDSCPDGCDGCIQDGDARGGCPQNSAKFKSIGNSSSLTLASEAKAREHFNAIDVDKNGSISLSEAIEHLWPKLGNGTAAENVAAKNVSWFAKLDRNGNNQIDPGEFDRSLI